MPIINLILCLFLTAILVQQTLGSQGRPRRRWALLLGACAFGLATITNLLTLLNVNLASFSGILAGTIVVLMAASLLLLLRAWQTGELRGQMDQVQRAVEEERRKRGS